MHPRFVHEMITYPNYGMHVYLNIVLTTGVNGFLPATNERPWRKKRLLLLQPVSSQRSATTCFVFGGATTALFYKSTEICMEQRLEKNSCGDGQRLLCNGKEPPNHYNWHFFCFSFTCQKLKLTTKFLVIKFQKASTWFVGDFILFNMCCTLLLWGGSIATCCIFNYEHCNVIAGIDLTFKSH